MNNTEKITYSHNKELKENEKVLKSLTKRSSSKKKGSQENLFFWERGEADDKTSFFGRKSEREVELRREVKRIRAYDECLGIRSRRRT